MLSGLKQFRIRGPCSPWAPWHLLLTVFSQMCSENPECSWQSNPGFFPAVLCGTSWSQGAGTGSLLRAAAEHGDRDKHIFFSNKKMCFLWKVRQGINNVSEYRAEQGLCWNRIKIKFVSSSWVHALTEGWKEKVTAQQQISHFSETNARAARQSKHSGTMKGLAFFLLMSGTSTFNSSGVSLRSPSNIP